MAVVRFFAIVLIFGCVTIAWWVLGITVHFRTRQLDDSLSAEMASLWGPKVLAQGSPYWAPTAKGARSDEGAIGPSSSRITADIKHEHRYKGLLWYSTFEVDFTATYTVPAADANAGRNAGGEGFFIFPLPPEAATYRDLSVEVDDKAQRIAPSDIPAGRIAVPLNRDTNHTVMVHYRNGGQDAWLYCPGDAPRNVNDDDRAIASKGTALSEVKNLTLTVTTDFTDIDYPKGSLSPSTRATASGAGMKASWDCPNLITSQFIGIEMPKRQNAGPIAARMSYFAPVSLFFFYTVLFTVVVLKSVRLHPMHYLFIAAGFFAFHILMCYLADLINIHPAFWISAVVSVFLVVSYLRLAAGVKFAVIYAGVAQLVYLVGFSYAFFWKGYTGLTVTIAAVITLFILMQATGRVNWHDFFKRSGARAAAPARPATLTPVAPQQPQQPAVQQAPATPQQTAQRPPDQPAGGQ